MDVWSMYRNQNAYSESRSGPEKRPRRGGTEDVGGRRRQQELGFVRKTPPPKTNKQTNKRKRATLGHQLTVRGKPTNSGSAVTNTHTLALSL